jgi:hypothetical protein
MMDCSKDFNEENSEPEQHHAGTDDGQDDETKQDDSKGRKTNKQSHVDVDVTITNKNKSTKASTKEVSSTKGNKNKPEPAKDSPRKVRTHHFMPTFMTLSTHPIIRTVIYKVSWS